MTNIAFCTPGATVIELFPSDYVNVCYWNLATAVEGLAYRYLVGNGTPTRQRSQLGVDSDIRVDIRQLLRLVDGAKGG